MSTPHRADLLLPAPGRGQYDRAITRERRQAEQRERLLIAAAAAFARGRESVSATIELAGVGRNTFYEYFDDYAHALEAVRGHVLAAVTAAWRAEVSARRSARERLRGVCIVWWRALLVERDAALVLLCAEPRRPEHPLSRAGLELAASLDAALAEVPPRASRVDEILIVAAGGEALALSALQMPVPERAQTESVAPATLLDAAERLAL